MIMFDFRKKEKPEPQNIEDLAEKLKEMESIVVKMKEEINILQEKQKSALQRFSLIRFNPFSDRGGDQSFSFVILDEEKNGIIITSYYSKEGNRVYGKLVEKGGSRHPLSKEEEEVIKNAYNEQ